MTQEERSELKQAKSQWKRDIIKNNPQYKGLSSEQIARKLNKSGKTVVSRY